MEGLRDENDPTKQKSLTTVDIECDMPRAGLGPERMEELVLQKEDIGLKQLVILIDYLSPPRGNYNHTEITLAPNSIMKCRSACGKLRSRSLREGKHQYNKDDIYHEKCRECDWIQDRAKYRKEEKSKKKGGEEESEYGVDFPSDEEEGEGSGALNACNMKRRCSWL